MENSGGIPKSNLLHNFNTKERSCNFNKEEVKRLQSLVEKYKNILMCKKTDGTSTKQKELIWDNIGKEFNSTGQIPRTTKQLKYKFENMKRSAKKEATRERQEMRRTGGGKPPAFPPASEEATDWLRSIMSTSIDGNESLYDDDVIAPNLVSSQNNVTNLINSDVDEISQSLKKPNLDNNVIVLTDADYATCNLPQNAEMDVEKFNEIPFDCSTPHSSLRKPKAQPLRRKIQKKLDDNVVKRALREQKQSVLKELNEIELDKIRSSIRNQNELHGQMIQHNAERHTLELEIRQQLKQHNDEKFKLELEKLKLEIDIIKKNINK